MASSTVNERSYFSQAFENGHGEIASRLPQSAGSPPLLLLSMRSRSSHNVLLRVFLPHSAIQKSKKQLIRTVACHTTRRLQSSYRQAKPPSRTLSSCSFSHLIAQRALRPCSSVLPLFLGLPPDLRKSVQIDGASPVWSSGSRRDRSGCFLLTPSPPSGGGPAV